MNLLLDTHVLLRWLSGEALTPQAMARVADPESASAAVRRAAGELGLDLDVLEP